MRGRNHPEAPELRHYEITAGAGTVFKGRATIASAVAIAKDAALRRVADDVMLWRCLPPRTGSAERVLAARVHAWGAEWVNE